MLIKSKILVFALVAFNQLVAGSNPARPTIFPITSVAENPVIYRFSSLIDISGLVRARVAACTVIVEEELRGDSGVSIQRVLYLSSVIGLSKSHALCTCINGSN